MNEKAIHDLKSIAALLEKMSELVISLQAMFDLFYKDLMENGTIVFKERRKEDEHKIP